MTKLQVCLRDVYGRDRNGNVLVPQRDAEEIVARLDLLEELLRLVHLDVVRATGVLVHLDDRIAAALTGNQQKGED